MAAALLLELELHLDAVDQIRKRFDSLSPSQKNISQLLSGGLTNVAIAELLGVTVHTIKAHRAEVMRRMEAASFADLVSQLQRLHTSRAMPEKVRSDITRIIVVEDDSWYREYLVENLRERSFIVTGVANGSDLAAALAAQPADIVILDIELGDLEDDGLTIATRLQAHSDCGLIMVTSRGNLDDRLKGLSTGADAYLAKPVNIEELAMTIANLARRII